MTSHVLLPKLFRSSTNRTFQKFLNSVARIGLGTRLFVLYKKLIFHTYSHGDTKLGEMILHAYRMNQMKHSNGKNLLAII